MERDNDFSAAEFKTQDAQCGAGRRPDGSRVRQAPKPAPKSPPDVKPSSSQGAQLPRWEKRDLLAQVTVAEVIAKFGIMPNQAGFIRCILPGHEDASPSMKLTPNRFGLHCFACDRTVNALDAFRLLTGHAGSFPQLCDHFGATFGVAPSNASPSASARNTPQTAEKASFSPGEERKSQASAQIVDRAKASLEDSMDEAACGPWQFVTEYFYASAGAEGLPRGTLVWRKQRYQRLVPAGSKCRPKLFRQHFSADEGRTWGMKPRQLPPLLPFLWRRFAPHAEGRMIFINEGEKAAFRLHQAGLLATCGHDAGRLKPDEAAELVRLPAFLVVIADADKEGWRKGLHNLRQLCLAREAGRSEARGIAWLTLKFPFGSKKDAWDYLEEGGNADALQTLVETRAFWMPKDEWDPELQKLQEVAAVMTMSEVAR